MRGFEILDMLKCLPIVYGQLYQLCCIDTIPQELPLKQYIIVNKDKISSKGSHWFVCVRSESDCIEIFDSLGTSASYVKEHFSRYPGTIEYNSTATQKKNSESCALHCVYFLCKRILDFDIEFVEVMDTIFNGNHDMNEDIVLKYIKDLNDE